MPSVTRMIGSLILACILSAQVLMSGMLSEKRLAGEYELMLSADAPLHDIIQASILYRSGGGLLLSLPGLEKPIEIKANSKHPLEYEGIDRNGEILYSANQSFTVQFMAGNQVEITACRIANAEISYQGPRIHSGQLPAPEARADFNTPISVEALRHDFCQLRRIMEHVHPALYVFTDKSQFDRLFSEQKQKIDRPMNVNQFYSIIAPLVACIGCGHAAMIMPKGFITDQTVGLFPLKLHIDGQQAHVLLSLAVEIPGGAEILSIDDLAMAEIIAQLKSHITSDGLLDSTKAYRLNQSFPILYANALGLKSSFKVRYQVPPSTQIKESEIQGVVRSALCELWPSRQGKTPIERHLKFEILPENKVAVLTIHSFGFYDDPPAFQRFIDQSFSEMRRQGVSDLILDLRDNDGGDPFCSAYLLKYLSDKPVPYFSLKYGAHYATLAQPHIPAERPFAGRSWILIDGGCLSSTTHLCALFKYHGIGRFVGSETAGNYTCNDNSKEFVLSYSGIAVNLARRTYAVAVSDMPRDRGIRPDFHVEAKLDDLLGDIDTVKEFVVKKIINQNIGRSMQ